MSELFIVQVIVGIFAVLVLGFPIAALFNFERSYVRVMIVYELIAFATIGFMSVADNLQSTYPWSTYIQDGTILAEGDAVIEKLPSKFQQAVAQLRYSSDEYQVQEASVKNKLKGDGIQQDHTVVWLSGKSSGFAMLKNKSIFIGISHDISGKIEQPALKVELSESGLRDMLSHFPAELRDPVMSTYELGGYKAYGLGPTTYSTFNSVSDVCAIQLVKTKPLPIDIANQRQYFVIDEVDVYLEDRSITPSIRP